MAVALKGLQSPGTTVLDSSFFLEMMFMSLWRLGRIGEVLFINSSEHAFTNAIYNETKF